MAKRSAAEGQGDGDRHDAETLSERAATLIQNDILSGVWSPGEKLGIVALSEHYGIGPTPVREGLSRLTSRDLIRAVGQKGFRVAPLSEADLRDITLVRTMIEVEALRRSMRDGTDEWEAGIVAALHRLVRQIERDPKSLPDDDIEFDRLHKAFHRSLLEACGSERLLRLHDDFYYQAYRYRRLMMSRYVAYEAEFLAEHQLLADLALSRNFEAAEKELVVHLGGTLEIVYGGKSPVDLA